jgi:prepilin-type N-terminal cleavage/methylation domain-containing protein
LAAAFIAQRSLPWAARAHKDRSFPPFTIFSYLSLAPERGHDTGAPNLWLETTECLLKTENLEGNRRLEQSLSSSVKTAIPSQRSRAVAKVRATGFTMVELLIVIALILTIAAIAVPNLLTAINRAKIAKAVADVHTIGNAVVGYQAATSNVQTL